MSQKVVEVGGIQYFTLLEKAGTTETSPCVLLCHALMSNLHMYDRTVRALHAAGFATLRVDHIGHNRTPPPQDSSKAAYHLDDITGHMHHIVREVTGQTHVAAVVGCSISGVLALRYAMLFPQDVDAVVSITAPSITSPAAAKPMWADRIRQFEEDVRTGDDVLCRKTVERWIPGERAADDAARAEALTHVKTCSLPGYRILADAIRNYDYAAEVGKIEGVRSLIVAGREDSSSSADGLRQLAGEIKGAEFVCIEHAGHLPPIQRPTEFNETLLAFLK